MPIDAPRNPGHRHDEHIDRHEPQRQAGPDHQQQGANRQQAQDAMHAAVGPEANQVPNMDIAANAIHAELPFRVSKSFRIEMDRLPSELLQNFGAGMSLGMLSYVIPAVHQFLSNRSSAGLLGMASAFGALIAIAKYNDPFFRTHKSPKKLKQLEAQTGGYFSGSSSLGFPLEFMAALAIAGVVAGRRAGSLLNHDAQTSSSIAATAPLTIAAEILITTLMTYKLDRDIIHITERIVIEPPVAAPDPIVPDDAIEPQNRQHLTNTEFTPEEMKTYFTKACDPFDKVFALTLTNDLKASESILSQMRFFSAMEGPAERFGLKCEFFFRH